MIKKLYTVVVIYAALAFYTSYAFEPLNNQAESRDASVIKIDRLLNPDTLSEKTKYHAQLYMNSRNHESNLNNLSDREIKFYAQKWQKNLTRHKNRRIEIGQQIKKLDSITIANRLNIDKKRVDNALSGLRRSNRSATFTNDDVTVENINEWYTIWQKHKERSK